MIALLMLLLLLQTPFGTNAPPSPPATPIVTPSGTIPGSPQPIAPAQTPFGTTAPPVQPTSPVLTPFGSIPGTPTPPVVTEPVALFIGGLIYGSNNALTQITDNGISPNFCLGKQQYFPSSIVTFLGTLANLPQAGQPKDVKWTCGASWAEAVAQAVAQALVSVTVP